MVALLKGGRINNRLLCELATHKDFIKFLADIEIYVCLLYTSNVVDTGVSGNDAAGIGHYLLGDVEHRHHDAVSYTHLDVYKRQPSNIGRCWS